MTEIQIKLGEGHWLLDWLNGELGAAALQAVAVLAAAWLGFRAVGRQIKETETRRLKTQILEEGLSVSRRLSDAASGFQAVVARLSQEVQIAAKAEQMGLQNQLPSLRFRNLLESLDVFSRAALNLAFLIETRQFLDPRLLVFRDAVLSVLHDSQNLFHKEFPPAVLPTLPMDKPEGGLFPYVVPTVDAANEVKRLCELAHGVLSDAQCVASDFQVELQNLLAKDLFGHTVQHRVPIDPRYRVLTLERAEELRAWLSSETSWGRECSRIDEETKARMLGGAKDEALESTSPPAPSPPP